LKFFLPINKIKLHKNIFKKNKQFLNKNGDTIILNTIDKFNGMIMKNGFSTKYKNILLLVFLKINFFIYSNINYLYSNYSGISWVFENIFEKKLNYQLVFDNLVNLLKPPFVVKSLLVSKKLKKKLKIKYTIKIVYKKDGKRVKNALKQLYYNSNNFNENRFSIRLYKSLLFSFLD
jgi:hypothetical protein